LREPYARLNRGTTEQMARWPFTSCLNDGMLHLPWIVLYIDTSSLQCVTVLPEFITKEVIRLQVPLQPPCYDFSPLAELRFDPHNMR
jgi:hypothetical protein